MKKVIAILFAFMAVIALVNADCYMHNPRGSNNRLNGNGANTQNQNRLFDSQNNAAGGYCWGPPMHFFVGSQLSIEWTNQHSCGQQNTKCDVVIQYMCADHVRDGNTTSRIADNADTYDEEVSPGFKRYGMHETYDYYQDCKTRERNKGLFTADRNVNRQDARGTRQNNNGNRRGFECPEERDYYPYWHPTPWVDIAVLTTDTKRCEFYKSESQNVKAKNYCEDKEFNNEIACPSGQWKSTPAHSKQPGKGCISSPECLKAQWNRDNHLGNGINGYPNMYNWTIPDCIVSEKCVLRIRYNISTTDYDGWNTFASLNGRNLSPIKQDPYVDALGCGPDSDKPCNLTLAIDTSQFGRTFQDRSHVFAIRNRPSGVSKTARIFNLNVKGKRGNIVQAYPATEYDFTPNVLMVRSKDYIHMQWTGCDTNPSNFAGEGRRGTDRSNIVQLKDAGDNRPWTWTDIPKGKRLFKDEEINYRAAYLDQTNCKTAEELNGNQQDVRNCGVLNAASPYMDLGLYRVSGTGTFHYMSSRNNNYSNRSQKGMIVASQALKTFGVVVVSVGSAAFAAALVFAGLAAWNQCSPNSPLSNSSLFNQGN